MPHDLALDTASIVLNILATEAHGNTQKRFNGVRLQSVGCVGAGDAPYKTQTLLGHGTHGTTRKKAYCKNPKTLTEG